jgi:acyl-CoA thioesterase I
MKLLLALALVFCIVDVSAQSRVKVACVGNSITEGASIEESMRYPAQLQTLLGDTYEVRNYGLGGRTLLKKGDYPYWQEDKYKEVLAWIPDIVIIKLGTNDSKPQNWIYSEDFVSDYRAFIQSFKKLPGKRKIYICKPIPVFKDEWGITEVIVRDEIVPMIEKIGKSESVKIVDLYSAFAGKGALLPDGVHPDAAGATIIADEVYKVLEVPKQQVTQN